jgi:hypothetical protein
MGGGGGSRARSGRGCHGGARRRAWPWRQREWGRGEEEGGHAGKVGSRRSFGSPRNNMTGQWYSSLKTLSECYCLLYTLYFAYSMLRIINEVYARVNMQLPLHNVGHPVSQK